ncbi:MAG: hypothetical protein MUF49_27155 [Oculatellaceae cyanobacterium Prado106]|jgi:hypothetical protein|nr:hypothetical protein [Oculatellaceae cyanobacterium Prado106]
MFQKKLRSLLLFLCSTLVIILCATGVQAQTDININNRNLIRVGGDVVIAPNQVVENANAVGGDVTIQRGARVTETAIAIGGDVILEENAIVDGDAYAVGGQVITAPSAIIRGTSGTMAEDGRWGAQGLQRGRDGFGVRYLLGAGSHLLTILLSTVVGALLIRWRSGFLNALSITVQQAPIQCVFWGLGGIVAAVILIILLTVSLIGIPLLPLVGLLIATAVLVGTLGVALWIGQRVWHQSGRSPLQQFLMGMLVLTLIGLVPLLGGLILSVVNLMGLGALLTWQFGGRERLTVDQG